MTLIENLASKLVGASKKDAIDTLEAMNVEYRFIRIDDDHFMVTADYREDRVNLAVVGEMIVDAYVG